MFLLFIISRLIIFLILWPHYNSTITYPMGRSSKLVCCKRDICERKPLTKNNHVDLVNLNLSNLHEKNIINLNGTNDILNSLFNLITPFIRSYVVLDHLASVIILWNMLHLKNHLVKEKIWIDQLKKLV